MNVGDVLAGYRIEGVLGRGGMGTVYLATHQRLERKAALKVLIPEIADDEDFRERFIRESQIAAALDHPNVVPIYDADEEDGVPFIAMRYVEGSDLKSQLRERVRLSTERALEVIEQVASALDAAHEVGLVHRDVKPANILIEKKTGRAYLTDFGVAKSSTATGLTRTGSFLGTVDYCAPEQISGKPVDRLVDVYALGCVLYHCLTGQPPYVRETEVAVVQAHLADPIPALSTVRPDLPHELDGVIVTAMAKHPEVRFATAGALAEAFRVALVGGEGVPKTAPSVAVDVQAPPPPPPAPPMTVADAPHPMHVAVPPPHGPTSEKTRVMRWHPSKRLWLAGAAALVVIVVAAVAAIVLSSRSGTTPGTRKSGAKTGTTAPTPGRSTFNSQVADIVDRVVPAQTRATTLVGALQPTPAAFSAVRRAGDALNGVVLRAQGSAEALSPAGPAENRANRALLDSLAKQERYARSLSSLPAPSALTAARAQALRVQAAAVKVAYQKLRSRTGSPCCRPMPAGADAARRFVVVVRSRPSNVGLVQFVDRIENLLNQSASGRVELVRALTDATNCSIYPEEASGRVASVADNRQSLLEQLGSLQTPTPEAARVATLLQAALSHSIEADRHYRDWLASLAGSGCPLPQTSDYSLARSEDGPASAAKREFVAAFNPLARKFHRRTWSESEI